MEGRPALADLLRLAPHGIHLPGAARIALDGDRARTVQSYAFVSTSTDEWNAGWYLRDLVRTAAGWKIARTVVKFARKEALPANPRARRLDYPVRFD